jgi:hypothetical protein
MATLLRGGANVPFASAETLVILARLRLISELRSESVNIGNHLIAVGSLEGEERGLVPHAFELSSSIVPEEAGLLRPLGQGSAFCPSSPMNLELFAGLSYPSRLVQTSSSHSSGPGLSATCGPRKPMDTLARISVTIEG